MRASHKVRLAHFGGRHGTCGAASDAHSQPEEPMAHTHEYDCIVCGAHFDSSKDLDKHNQEQHVKQAKGMEVPRTTPSSGAEPDRKLPEA
jgi:hypothetical protein